MVWTVLLPFAEGEPDPYCTRLIGASLPLIVCCCPHHVRGQAKGWITATQDSKIREEIKLTDTHWKSKHAVSERNQYRNQTYVSSSLQPATVQILQSCFIKTFLCLVQIKNSCRFDHWQYICVILIPEKCGFLRQPQGIRTHTRRKILV